MAGAAKSPCVFLDLLEVDEAEEEVDFNNNEISSYEQKRDILYPEESRASRRKSSASRYGFDDNFIELVAKNCQLELETEEILGRGSFGTVVAANYQGVPVAAKIIDTKGKLQAESVKKEGHALDLPPHAHIVIPLEIFQLGKDTAIILLPRLRKGNLLAYLNMAASLTHQVVVSFAFQIASALAFCHTQGLLHLDLKPQNILIDFEDNLRLSDFGNSIRLIDLPQSTIQLEGTVAYKAPELFCGHAPTIKADVYSFGITLWQILYREIPYFGENEHSIIYKVVAQSHRPTMPELQGNSKDTLPLVQLEELYRSCWDQNPNLRPDMNSILVQLSSIIVK